MSHPRSSLRALAAGLALATLVPMSLAPAVAEACTADMQVPDEALTVIGSWPAQDEPSYPVDGIVRIFHEPNVHRRRAPADFAVRVTEVATGAEVPMRFLDASHRPATEAWWAPDDDWRSGATYRLEVTRPEGGAVLHTVSWQVGPGPERPVGLLDDFAEWCDDAVPVLGPCVPGEVEGCDPCALDYVSAWIAQVRLRLQFPDAEVWARTGRTPVLGGERLADRRLETDGAFWQAHFSGGELGACFELRIETRLGQVETRVPLCPPAPLPRCPDARPLPESTPGDAGLGGDLDAAAPGTGPLDAGAPGTDGDAATHSTQPVVEKSGCQAGPGVDGVPLAAGLLAILAGLPRRRRG